MKSEFFVICDNIRSLYNVGSIFRTSDALGVTKLFLCGITGTPVQKGVLKVSLGAENSVPWEYAKNTWQLVEKLKKQGLKMVALELGQGSIDIKNFKPKFPCALILGNEINGVSPAVLKRCDKIIHIPMRGLKESLNVSVAFGIAGYLITNFKLRITN
jgi:tRNA G18 (ribose-2'-O)-methylase SpoU